MSAPRKLAIPQSLVRPLLVAGGEREPIAVVFATGAGFLSLGWNLHSWVAASFGLLILGLGLPALRKIAQADPIMFSVYVRQMFYRNYYAARATPRRRG